MKKPDALSKKQGFTLVEVALAVLAVGLGLITVFGLFPAGLQNASDDAADTRAGLFAGAVLSELRGAAVTNTTTVAWDSYFANGTIAVEGMTLTINGASPIAVKFPNQPAVADSPENYLRYMLSITTAIPGPPKTYAATLVTCDGQYGAFSTQNVFYTEFPFMGM